MASEAGASVGRPVTGPTRPWLALLQKLRGRTLARLGWGLADQAVSSLTNVAVSFYLVHTLHAAEFGAFGLAYVTYGFALNASRGLSTDPLMVRFSGTELPAWRRAVAGCTGTALCTGLLAGAFALGVAALLRGTTGTAFLALGLTLPGLMLQDSWRYSFFALGRGGHAFLNDMIWAAALAPALIILRDTRHGSVFWVVFAWGAAAAVAAAVGPFQARVVPDVRQAWAWLTAHRDLGPRYLAEGLISNASGQLRSYGTGIILGLAAVGYLQAMVTLMGPTTILFAAMGLVLIPEAARVLRRRPDRLWLFCILVSVGLTALGASWGVVLLIASPRGLGNVMLGAIWRPTYPLILPAALTVAASGCGGGAGAGLHAIGASRRSLRVAIIGTVATVGMSLAGAAEWGVVGTMWGTAIAAVLSCFLIWWQLWVALRDANISASSGLLASTGRHRSRTWHWRSTDYSEPRHAAEGGRLPSVTGDD